MFGTVAECHVPGDTSNWEDCMKLNVLAPMFLTHAFAPGMVKRKVLRPLVHL